LEVVDIAGGYSFSAVVTKSGDVYTWGFNEKSQLGHGYFFNVQSPKKIEFFAQNRIKIVKTACGQQHMAFLTDKGNVYTCGLGGMTLLIILLENTFLCKII
jgi:alpha-tubulin suppressor-like RCC1 family protein